MSSPPKSSLPVLVFLHGFLGSIQDWQIIIDQIHDHDVLCLDLPGHGKNSEVEVDGFRSTVIWLDEQLKHHLNDRSFVLIGYSLGGRIALNYSYAYQDLSIVSLSMHKYLLATIVEGANLGLTDQAQKVYRLANDQQWADKFINKSSDGVLDDWYRQPVFSHLNENDRRKLCKIRKQHLNVQYMTKMLMATSLSKQLELRENIKNSMLPLFYICGERDHKFLNLAKDNQLNYLVVSKAGHNAHLDNPKQFIQELYKCLSIYN